MPTERTWRKSSYSGGTGDSIDITVTHWAG